MVCPVSFVISLGIFVRCTNNFIIWYKAKWFVLLTDLHISKEGSSPASADCFSFYMEWNNHTVCAFPFHITAHGTFLGAVQIIMILPYTFIVSSEPSAFWMSSTFWWNYKDIAVCLLIPSSIISRISLVRNKNQTWFGLE